MTLDAFLEKIELMGGIVEEFLEGKHKRSPSAQFRVDPTGNSTSSRRTIRCSAAATRKCFSAAAFRPTPRTGSIIQELGFRAGKVLAAKGVLGRFGVDFISVPEDGGWRHYAIEINLRKGGTTHPFLMLQFLTAGSYDRQDRPVFQRRGQALLLLRLR